MAGQGVQAEVRVYRTVDGELVGEGDPKGAFLAYAVGQMVPAGEVEAYNRVKGRTSTTAEKAQDGDPTARDEMRRRLARDVAATPLRPGEPAPLMHDRLATELADEARVIANKGADAAVEVAEQVDDGRTVAAFRVYRTEDGDLVHEGHEKASTLAYAPGDTVADHEVEQYDDLGDPPAQGDADADTKMAAPVENKARTTNRRRS